MDEHEQNDTQRHPDFIPNPLRLKNSIDINDKRLKKSAVLGLFTALSVVIGIVALHAFAPPEQKKKADNYNTGTSEPDYKIKAIPSSYGQLKRETPTPAPKEELGEKGEEAAVKDLTAEEKILKEMELRRFKKRFEARESDIVFAGLKNVPQGKSQFGFEEISNGQTIGKSQEGGAKASGPESQRDADNRQDDKESFLAAQRESQTHVSSKLEPPRSPYEVLAGTQISGLMLSGINSDLPGSILGQVSQNVFDTAKGEELLIPQGTKIIGAYDSKVVYGQERVLIVWTRLVFPNGDSLNLEGMPGVDLSGYAGLSDQVNNHYFKLITGVVLTSVLGATAQVAQGPQVTFNPGYGQLVTQGAATNLNDAGQQITRKNLAIQPTIEIRPGMRFNIFVVKDLTLKPYEP